MASILIRNLDPEVKERLRRRAKRHGRSMEAEVRILIERMLAGEPAETGRSEHPTKSSVNDQGHWVDRVRGAFAEAGYWDDFQRPVLPERSAHRFDE
ncbi:MAG: Arc family DNA-binding protein [Alphaproteobacteria bacterium]|nr:Arc family DNA-binding protein [Alphaproteobacteria bacterium]